MADPQTLAALKRAYADTILNTTKEAAARVMFSEKKARRYQQELATVRDEAVHTLLRLKKLYDSKVKETEMVSLKQQEKIEELEAQLGEAEDIVGELRIELRELRSKLKKLTNGHVESSTVATTTEVPSRQERGVVVANGIKEPSLTSLSSIKRCSSDRCQHTLPSILIKRKEVGKRTTNGGANDGVCLCKVSSCGDSIASVGDGEEPMESTKTSQKDLGITVSLKTSMKEHGNDGRKSVLGETEARKEEKESCENVEVSVSSLRVETPPVLAVNKNQCIKFTFQRKRKKEALSNLEDSRNIKQKTGYLEPLEPGFVGESSRDSLCEAEVVQKIVPFSEKKGLQAEMVNR